MEAKKKGQALDMDFFSAMDHVEEQKEALWTTWMANGRQDFESAIRMAIQDIESLKNRYPELNVSVPSLLGKLDTQNSSSGSTGRNSAYVRLQRSLRRRPARSCCIFMNTMERGTGILPRPSAAPTAL